jgi:UDP-hydrolysing UDP-N-acetyl-D-glucosamine 2-epimerase
MSAPLKVLGVSASRADWGFLAPPLTLLRSNKRFDVKVAVTGQHLTKEGKASRDAILAENFAIDAEVDMLLDNDTARSVAKSMGLALIGFADVMFQLRPDLVLVLGDRYEILAAVQAALIARTPVAHMGGGDVTEGAFDEAIRHSITKMSHLHFVSNADAARRIRQLGENPGHIYNVGSTALDRIRLFNLLPRTEFFAKIGMSEHKDLFVITYHPATLEENSVGQCGQLLDALDALGPETGLLFTGVNADPGGRSVESMIAAFVAAHGNAKLFSALGSSLYFSALKYAAVVVGNSSSGLYEAPSFGVPTVNIGDRQKGRLRAASVVDCPPDRHAILDAINRARRLDCSGAVNPYGDGHASERIVAALERLGNPQSLLKKKFYDLAPG